MGPEYRSFVWAFIVIMGFQIALTVSMMLAACKLSRSRVWKDIIAGSVFCILMSATQASILLILESDQKIVLLIYASALMYVLTHLVYNINLYHLIKPVIKDYIEIIKPRQSTILIGIAITSIIYIMSDILIKITPQIGGNFNIIYGFSAISLGLACVAIADLILIYRSYKGTKFVSTSYGLGAMAGITLTLTVVLLLGGVIFSTLKDKVYYLVLFYLFSLALSLSFNLRFIVMYPSLLQPKWKSLLPVDVVRLTFMAVLVFTALSLYSGLKDSPEFARFTTIPAYMVIIVCIAVFMSSLTATYLWAIHTKTKLWYWRELRAGHLLLSGVMLYALALVIYSWNDLGASAKILAWIFIEFLLLFYIFRIFELSRTADFLRANIRHDLVHLGRYFISLASAFFILLMAITVVPNTSLNSKSANIMSLIMLGGSLPIIVLIVHTRMRSLADELRFNSPLGILGYFVGFSAFAIAYGIFRNIGDINTLQMIMIIGYISSLGLELHALIQSNRGQVKPKISTMKELLNYHARFWIRPESLEELLQYIKSEFKHIPCINSVQFDRLNRKFLFGTCDDREIDVISAAILLEMYSLRDTRGFSIKKTNKDEVVRDIEDILKINVLKLPDKLKVHFDLEKYYPILLRHVVDELGKEMSPFVSEEESRKIIKKLGKCNIAFNGLCEGKIPEKMSEDEFCGCLREYIASLEKKFPFEYSLFRTAIVRKTADIVSEYGISIQKALNIVPTGIESLDEILGGGFPKNSSTLLIIEHPVARDMFLREFTLVGLKNKDRIIFLSSEYKYDDIKSAILSELSDKYLKMLYFLDINESIKNVNNTHIINENGRIILPVNSILIQHAIVKSIKSIPKEAHKRVIIDAMRRLSVYYEKEDLWRMIATLVEGHKRWNCTLVVTCYPELGWCTDELRKIFDNVLVLTISGGEARVIVDKFYGGIPEERCLPLKS